MRMRPLTAAEALQSIETFARHTRLDGETDDQAMLRAIDEQPSLYAQYDEAKLREGKEGHVPAGLRPDPEKPYRATGIIAEKDAVMAELLQAGEDSPEGQRLAQLYDLMGTRAWPRDEAEAFLRGRE